MPILNPNNDNPTVDGRQSSRALAVRNGVARYFESLGYAFVTELGLETGHRADMVAIGRKSEIVIVEIKSSIEDFRVDTKWPEYTNYCDRYFFATLPDVPQGIFPETEGLIIADAYACEIVREAETRSLSAARRKAMTLRFARSAAMRLERVIAHVDFSGRPLSDDLLSD